MIPLKKTLLYPRQLELGAQMGSFGGWDMPISYGSILKEHGYCREQAAVFDISHMGEFIFKGDIQASGMEKAITQPLSRMAPGTCKYGFILNHEGGIIDDLIVLKLAADELMLVVNAAPALGDLEVLRERIDGDLLRDISPDTAKIDVQGPDARLVIKEALGLELDLRYFRFGNYQLEEEQVLIARAGYTGELGYEIYCSSSRAGVIWDRILEHEKAHPAGLGARDILRLEIGYSLYGQDLDQETNPYEADLGAFIYPDQEFVGKEALLKQKDQGLSKNKIAFKTASRRAPRSGYGIYLGDRHIGTVTSGCFSPMLSCGIGLGYIQPSWASSGLGWEIADEKERRTAAQVVPLPFYTEGSLRS